jgi:hypothetical protein
MIAGSVNAMIWYIFASSYIIPLFAASETWSIWSWIVIIPLVLIGWFVVAVGGKQYTRHGIKGVQFFAPFRVKPAKEVNGSGNGATNGHPHGHKE